MKNQMIIKAEAAIDAKVSPADKQAYDRIVLAGMKVMFSKETHGELMAGLKESQEPLKTAVEGIVGLLGLLFKESRNTMPVGPMILAGQSLLMEGLDFMEQGGMIQVTPDMLAEATQLYIETLLPKIGMSPEKMREVLGKAQGVMSDPQKMAQFKQQGGN
jgi:hypothetical protein